MEKTMERLSKALQKRGAGSRRALEEVIFEGRVQVNGVTIFKPEHHVGPNDELKIDGKKIKHVEKKLYFILNKPEGYLCSNERTGKQKLVGDLFSEVKERLYTVGRLDKETKGLLLVTNDGEFANRVMHPRFGVEKEYLVKADQEIDQMHLESISKGMWIEGTYVKPKKVYKIRKGTLKIILGDGKKREVRRLVEGAGLQVLELSRIRIGGLVLGKLPKGSWRSMTEREKELVFEAC